MCGSKHHGGHTLVTSCDQRLNSGHILEPFKMHNSNFPPTYLKKVFYKIFGTFTISYARSFLFPNLVLLLSCEVSIW